MSVRYKKSSCDSHDYPHKAANGTKELKRLISTLSRDNFHPEVIEDLIHNKRANPNVRDGQGLTLLNQLIVIGQHEVAGVFHDKILRTFMFLLQRPGIHVYLANDGRLLIHLVATMHDPRFLSLLLENSEDARECINFPSHSDQGRTALYFACQDFTVPLENFKNLLKYGADPNIKCGGVGRTPLQCLILAYSDPSSDINKLIAILNEFFKYPATRLGDPKLCDNDGKTLLHYAVEYESPRSVLDMLLGRGERGSIFTKDSYGRGPMELAELFNNDVAIRAMRCWFRARKGG